MSRSAGNPPVQLAHDRLPMGCEVFHRKVALEEAHPATDVESDPTGRNDPARLDVGGGHATDREAVSPMDVGHGHRGAHDAGQCRYVANLANRVGVDAVQQGFGAEDPAGNRHSAGPGHVVDAGGNLSEVHAPHRIPGSKNCPESNVEEDPRPTGTQRARVAKRDSCSKPSRCELGKKRVGA